VAVVMAAELEVHANPPHEVLRRCGARDHLNRAPMFGRAPAHAARRET
jgi:hypothetical protein